MIRVLIESPFAGKGPNAEKDRETNLRYVRACMHDCFLRGEAPYASHALYTQDGVLDDDVPDQRKTGIDAGLIWGACAAKTVLYVDRGISTGMIYGVENAKKAGRPIELRTLEKWQDDKRDDYMRIAQQLLSKEDSL